MIPITRSWLAAYLADTRGAASLEFMTLVPPLLYVLFSMGEAGVLMARSVILTSAVDQAVRGVRLGLASVDSYDKLKAEICERAFLIGDCADTLLLELTPLPSAEFGNYGTGTVRCLDREEEIKPQVEALDYETGDGGDIMVVQACVLVDPIFPGMGLGAMLPKDVQGSYAIVVRNAFMNEPEDTSTAG